MSRKVIDPVAAQRRYYTDTSTHYDSMHACEGDDDAWNFQLVAAFLQMVDAKSVLDVGAGTGRGVRRLREKYSGTFVCGVEPVTALIEQAFAKPGDTKPNFVQGCGEALPFLDGSFDAVCSFAILHHVPKPAMVIREMLRVARKAVFIVDSNRFGQGRWPVRAAKLALFKAGLWPLVNYAKTRGKGYSFTEGDGVAYSYSAYDSFDQIAKWADHLVVIPGERCKAASWLHPLLTVGGVLVAAFKENTR